MNRWSWSYSMIGAIIVMGASVGLWAILRKPAPPTGPTAIERKAQRLDELCRMVDTEIRIAQTPTPVLGRLATVCHSESD